MVCSATWMCDIVPTKIMKYVFLLFMFQDEGRQDRKQRDHRVVINTLHSTPQNVLRNTVTDNVNMVCQVKKATDDE